MKIAHHIVAIRNARDLGFEIDDIRRFLALWQDRSLSNADVSVLALAQVEELAAKARQLEQMRVCFYRLAETCRDDVRSDFPTGVNIYSIEGFCKSRFGS